MRSSIRTKMLAGILPAVALAFGAVYWVAQKSSYEGVAKLVGEKLVIDSKTLARSVDSLLMNLKADANTASKLDIAAQALDSGDAKNLRLYANSIVQTKDAYLAIAVTDEEGTVLGANTVNKKGEALKSQIEGQSFAQAPWFEKLMEGEHPEGLLWGPHRPAPLEALLDPKEQVVAYAYPVMDVMDEAVGTLVLYLSEKALVRLTSSYLNMDPAGAPKSLALVVDASGSLVQKTAAHRRSWEIAQFTDTVTSVLVGSQMFKYELAPLQSPLGKQLGWRAASIKSTAAFNEPVVLLGEQMMKAFAAGGALLMLVLLLVIGRMVAPLSELTSRVSNVRSADTFEPIELKQKDELGQLAGAFNKMIATLAASSRELAQTKQELLDLFNTIERGIFTVSKDQKIGELRSAFMAKIFEPEALEGPTDVFELLQLDQQDDEEEIAKTKFWFECLLEAGDELQWDLSKDVPLRRIRYRPSSSQNDRILELDYAPIYAEDESVERIMVIVQDVTERENLQRELAQQKETNQSAVQQAAEIVRMQPEFFELFVSETTERFMEVDALLSKLDEGEAPQQHTTALFRAMHTIKGNARMFKLKSMQSLAHRAEDRLSTVRDGEARFTSEFLMELKDDVATLKSQLQQFKQLGEEILSSSCRTERTRRITDSEFKTLRDITDQLGRRIHRLNAKVVPLRSPYSHLSTLVRGMSLSDVNEVFEPLYEMVTDVSSRSQKQVALKLEDNQGLRVEPKLGVKIRDLLVHMIRNSIDHGIELPEERAAQGKSMQGSIQVSSALEAGKLHVRLSDDGRGLDEEKIMKRGLERGLLTAESLRTSGRQAILQLIFAPGFSTAEQVSEISGRGVGADAVRAGVESLGGTLKLESEPGRGCEFELSIPVSAEQVMSNPKIQLTADMSSPQQAC